MNFEYSKFSRHNLVFLLNDINNQQFKEIGFQPKVDRVYTLSTLFQPLSTIFTAKKRYNGVIVIIILLRHH